MASAARNGTRPVRSAAERPTEAGCASHASQAQTVPAQATDVAATVLYALGVPISRTLAGHPLVSLFTDSFSSRYPVRYVATYGPPRSGLAARDGQPLDQEMIDRLRSLGYVR